MFSLETPGGGGYGFPGDNTSDLKLSQNSTTFTERGTYHEYRRLQESV